MRKMKANPMVKNAHTNRLVQFAIQHGVNIRNNLKLRALILVSISTFTYCYILIPRLLFPN